MPRLGGFLIIFYHAQLITKLRLSKPVHIEKRDIEKNHDEIIIVGVRFELHIKKIGVLMYGKFNTPFAAPTNFQFLRKYPGEHEVQMVAMAK